MQCDNCGSNLKNEIKVERVILGTDIVDIDFYCNNCGTYYSYSLSYTDGQKYGNNATIKINQKHQKLMFYTE